jgi:hypothetical protein
VLSTICLPILRPQSIIALNRYVACVVFVSDCIFYVLGGNVVG